MIVSFPPQFNTGSFHTIWRDIGNFKELRKNGRAKALVDLTNVSFIDAEGINYIALLPQFITNLGHKVHIRLPGNDKVLSFLELVGLLEYLYENYAIEGRGAPNTNQYQSATKLSQIQQSLKSRSGFISRAGRAYVINSNEIPSQFKKEVIKHHLFKLDEGMASIVTAVLFELVHNIFDHSRETHGCITVQYRKRNAQSGQLFVAVSDLGIGIEASFKDAWGRDSIVPQEGLRGWKVLEYATLPGVSSTGLGVRGFGLNTVTNMADIVHLTSGQGSFYLDKRKGTKKGQSIQSIPGTSVLLIFNIGWPEENGRTSA